MEKKKIQITVKTPKLRKAKMMDEARLDALRKLTKIQGQSTIFRGQSIAFEHGILVLLGFVLGVAIYHNALIIAGVL